MASFKIYVTDYEYASLEYERGEISKIDAEFIPLQCKTDEDVIRLASDADALLVQYTPITEKVFKSLKKLKIVSRYGVGVDCVDVSAATRNNVIVVNVPDYGIAEVSDHAMTLILNTIRKITMLANSVKNNTWDFKIAKPIGRLSTLTLGVVGCGRIGHEVLRKAQAFGFNLLAYDPFLDKEHQDLFGGKLVSFDELLAQSDVISIHAPLYNDTHHLFNKEVFSKMKKGAVLVNTARGGLIDQEALIEAVENGKLSGVGIDVCEFEPIEVENKLKTFENVVITPHIAWYSEESQVALQTKTAQEVVRVLKGQAPLNPVNNRNY